MILEGLKESTKQLRYLPTYLGYARQSHLSLAYDLPSLGYREKLDQPKPELYVVIDPVSVIVTEANSLSGLARRKVRSWPR